MNVQRNIGTRFYSRFCIIKVLNVTYSECVFVALFIQHAMRMSHTVICGLSGCTIFCPHYFINGTILEKKSYCTQNVF